MPFPLRSGVRAKRTVTDQGSKMRAASPSGMDPSVPPWVPGVRGEG